MGQIKIDEQDSNKDVHYSTWKLQLQLKFSILFLCGQMMDQEETLLQVFQGKPIKENSGKSIGRFLPRMLGLNF